MINVAAITSGRQVPSSRYRVRQHIAPLREIGVDVREYMPAVDKYHMISGPAVFRYTWQGVKLSLRAPGIVGSWAHRITWLERELLPGRLTLEALLKHPLIFDLDDAIWLTPPHGLTAIAGIAKQAAMVIAGNRYLAEWLSAYTDKIEIVPTAVDSEQFFPRKDRLMHPDRYIVGWIGTHSNLEQLVRIERPLSQFLDQHKNAALLVICDQAPHFSQISPERVQFVPWSAQNEAETVRHMDVGLMPLTDDVWSRGKCSFKMLQYMASGIPVVVSPVGMNAEVLSLGQVGLAATTEAEWYDAIEYFYNNQSSAGVYGLNGRSVVESHFSRQIVSARLASIFKRFA